MWKKKKKIHNIFDYFLWYGLPMCERSKDIIFSLLKRISGLEAEASKIKGEKIVGLFVCNMVVVVHQLV